MIASRRLIWYKIELPQSSCDADCSHIYTPWAIKKYNFIVDNNSAVFFERLLQFLYHWKQEGIAYSTYDVITS